MSSPTFTQFNSHTHPSHAHRHGSTSSTSSSGSLSGPLSGGRNATPLAPVTPFQASTSYHQRRASVSNQDPFAAHREPGDDPFASRHGNRRASDAGMRHMSDDSGQPLDRKMSREWDASKVPPSKFQRPEGSIFATPASRDGHVARNKLKLAMDKVKEKTRK